MQTICIVVCFFGPWPRWFEIFLETCRHNPTIQFLFLCDCDLPSSIPENARFLPLTLEHFSAQAADKLELSINVQTPYKLCDLRPAFGMIFAKYLKDFDFWGYTDLDVIFGNIRRFITDEVLSQHDVISTREAYLSGHFTLYRNVGRINRLYEQSADHKRIFEEESYQCFDECGFNWRDLLEGRPIAEVETAIESMTHVVKRLADEGAIRAYLANLVKEQMDVEKDANWRFCWDQGRLVDLAQGDEFLYFHFHTLKNAAQFVVPQWRVVPARYYVSAHGFSVK